MAKGYKDLTLEQRYIIKAHLDTNQSNKFIAESLGVTESTISRETKRCGERKKYTPLRAQEIADMKKEQLSKKRKFTSEIEKIVKDKICNEQWSPKQIVGYYKKLKEEGKTDVEMVSHERIYQFVREDKKKGGKIYLNTRHKLKNRASTFTNIKISIFKIYNMIFSNTYFN